MEETDNLVSGSVAVKKEDIPKEKVVCPDDLVPFIKYGEYDLDKNCHEFVLTRSYDNMKTLWENICKIKHPRVSEKSVFILDYISQSSTGEVLDTEQLLFYQGVTFTEDDSYSYTLFSSGNEIQFTALSINELVNYLMYYIARDDIVYSFWSVIVSDEVLYDYKNAKPFHACVLIFNHKRRTVHFFDSNGTNSILGKSLYTDYIFTQYFEQLNELGINYKYILCNKWMGKGLQTHGYNDKEFDKGNCLAWIMLFTHWLSLSGLDDPRQLYEKFSNYSNEKRNKVIYCYMWNISNYFAILDIEDQHIKQELLKFDKDHKDDGEDKKDDGEDKKEIVDIIKLLNDAEIMH